jgi:hypothetical protein
MLVRSNIKSLVGAGTKSKVLYDKSALMDKIQLNQLQRRRSRNSCRNRRRKGHTTLETFQTIFKTVLVFFFQHSIVSIGEAFAFHQFKTPFQRAHQTPRGQIFSFVTPIRNTIATRQSFAKRIRAKNEGWVDDVVMSNGPSILDKLLDRDDNSTKIDFPGIRTNLDSNEASTRRHLFGIALITASTSLMGCGKATAYGLVKDDTMAVQQQSRLQWQVTPVNKRTGVTVYDAERAGYKVNFVTYLSRFLLTFDTDCQRWWYNRASDIPRTATAEQVTQYRNAQFAAFSASVEVGLQEYRGRDGPEKLLLSLMRRYGPDSIPRDGMASDASTRSRQERESREARRQICLLFGLMEQNQPVAALTKQLAAIDNGSIRTVVVEDRGSGYAPGYGSPQVQFPAPEAGEGYETATGRAVLTPNGKLLRIDVVNRGYGYSKPPIVSIAPPAVIRFSDSTNNDSAEAAEAVAYIFRSGPNKGRIQRIELTKPGEGYTLREIIRIRVDPPDLPNQEGGITATATAVLEYEVSDILIVNNGTGYAVEKPIRVTVEPPPLTARVNMNDPMMARIIAPDQPLPATTIPSPELRKRMPDEKDPKSIVFQANTEASKGGGGGCIGRACYDRPVRAVAFAASESKNVFDSFRQTDDDPLRITNKNLKSVDLAAATLPPQRIVSASDSTGDIPEPINFISGGAGASSELLTLLPAGVGLEFNALYNRYELAVDPNYEDKTPLWMRGYSTARKIDPDFGPRGRAPIERDMQLGVSSYLRFVLSGAICCSGVHLVLTPIDGMFMFYLTFKRLILF